MVWMPTDFSGASRFFTGYFYRVVAGILFEACGWEKGKGLTDNGKGSHYGQAGIAPA